MVTVHPGMTKADILKRLEDDKAALAELEKQEEEGAAKRITECQEALVNYAEEWVKENKILPVRIVLTVDEQGKVKLEVPKRAFGIKTSGTRKASSNGGGAPGSKSPSKLSGYHLSYKGKEYDKASKFCESEGVTVGTDSAVRRLDAAIKAGRFGGFEEIAGQKVAKEVFRVSETNGDKIAYALG